MHEKKYLVLFAGLLLLVGTSFATAQNGKSNSYFSVFEGFADVVAHADENGRYFDVGTNGETDTLGEEGENGNGNGGGEGDPDRMVSVTIEATGAEVAGTTGAGTNGPSSTVQIDIVSLIPTDGGGDESPAGGGVPLPIVFSFAPGTTVAAAITPASLAAAMSPFTYPGFITALQEGTLGLGVTNADGSTVIAIPPTTANYYFAQFGDGAGLSTDVVLINSSVTGTISGTVSFFDPDGDPLTVNLLPEDAAVAGTDGGGGDPVESFDFTLPVYASLTRSTAGIEVFDDEGVSLINQGSIAIHANAMDDNGMPLLPSLGADLRFELVGVGIAGVPFGTEFMQAAAPVRTTTGDVATSGGIEVATTSGVAVRNTTNAEMTVTLTLFETTDRMTPGSPIAGTSVTLAPNARESRLLLGWFPGQADTLADGFQGLVRAVSSDGSYVMLVLEIGNGFTTFSPVARQVLPGS